MKTSPPGRALTEAFEGLFLRTYDDGEGVLTIGYGHTSAAGYPLVVRDMVITSDKADEILTNDLAPCEARVTRLVTVPLTQYEFDALVSFEFNTGDLAKSSIPAKINAGRKADAMDTLSRYVHGANSGKLYPGLVRRRKGERTMFEGNVAAALALAGMKSATVNDPMPKKAAPAPDQPRPQQPVPMSPHPSIWSALLSAVLSIFRGKK